MKGAPARHNSIVSSAVFIFSAVRCADFHFLCGCSAVSIVEFAVAARPAQTNFAEKKVSYEFGFTFCRVLLFAGLPHRFLGCSEVSFQEGQQTHGLDNSQKSFFFFETHRRADFTSRLCPMEDTRRPLQRIRLRFPAGSRELLHPRTFKNIQNSHRHP